MEELLEAFLKQINASGPLDLFIMIASTVFMVFVIIIVFNLIQLITGRLLKNRLNPQRTFIVKKSIKYTGFVMAMLFFFRNIGVDTSAILGAAGVIGIAVGFAAQTTISSLISGFFLLSEKPFKVGDAIRVDSADILGIVLTVDILSVKIRTFDNLYMRIPNETLFKSNVVNLSRFPIRRLNVTFNLTYNADLERVKEILTDIAAKNTYVLDNPAPLFRIEDFGRAGPVIIFNVWFDKDQFLETRTSMYMAIQKRFAEENIELPYQKMDIKINSGEAENFL